MKDGARSVQIGLLILAILIPLLVFRPSKDCFLLPKETFSQVFIVVIFACWLINCIKKGRLSLLYSPLNKPMLAFILICGLSLFYAHSPYSGLRELRVLVSYGLVFLLAINNMRGTAHTDRLVTAMMFAGLLSSIYGILQYYNIDLFPWIAELGPRRKVFSTHGNVQFLAGYLILLLPVGVGFLLSNVAKAKRLFTAFAIVPMYICLMMTYGRGAWISLFISILLIAVIIGRRRFTIQRRRWVLTALTVIILVTVLFSLSGPLQRRGLTIASQMSTLFEQRTETVAGRWLTWQVCGSMMKDYRLLGIGLGNFKFRYPDYLGVFLSDEKGVSYRAYASRKLRAHNDYLQVGVEMGLVGAVVLGWCICTFLIVGVPSLRRVERERFPLVAGMVGGILAISIYALIFFPFQVSTIGLSFFLIMALLSGEVSHGKVKTFSFSRLTSRRKFILIEAIVILAIFFSTIATRPLVADVYYRRGLTHVRNNELHQAMANYLKGLSWDPDRGELHFEAGYVELTKTYYDKAIEEFQKSLKTLNSELIYYHMANAYAKKGMLKEAISHYKKAIAIRPAFSAAHTNLGNVYAREGRWKETVKWYKRAIGSNPGEIGARLNLASYWFREGNREKAVKLWEEVLEIDPKNQEVKDYLEKFGK